MHRSVMLLLTLAACGPDAADNPEAPVVPTGPVEQYGFVARLGQDTASVEWISRSADALISDGVDRWPFVRQRHTEFEIAPDGRLVRMVMDVRTPNGITPAERGRRVVARFTDDSVMVTIQDSSGTSGRSFATGGALTVPHASMVYSVIEFEIAAALRRAAATGQGVGDTLQFLQFYPDRDIGPSFVMHSGRVQPLEGGRVELRHGWLSGVGDVTVDSSGRMLTYSGQRSTYKVAVERITDRPDIEALGAAFAAAEQRTGPSQLSVRDTARGSIGPTTISVDYGRPLARGRVLLGNVISYDRVWRTGANAATQFTTSTPITLAGLEVPAGSYTLWTIPRTDGVELIVNRQVGQWGTEFDPAQNLGRAPMQSETVEPPAERFTISVVETDAQRGMLVMEWGTFRWRAPIVVRR
jgi:hypothetical protein